MKGYQAHESFWADLQMYFKFVSRGLILGAIFQAIILLLMFNSIGASFNHITITGTNIQLPASVAFNYVTGFDPLGKGLKLEQQLKPYARGWIYLPLNYYRTLADRLTNNRYRNILLGVGNKIGVSFLAYLLTVVYILFFTLKSRRMEDDKFVRGSEIIPLEKLNRMLSDKAQKNPLSTLKIGDTIIPFEMEPKHILILGSAGSGKSVLLNQLVVQINERKFRQETNERCIFYDLKGEFVAKQFNSKLDLIFSPFDSRSIQWNFFNEIENYPDYDVVAKSLYLCDDPKNEYWYNCARDVFRAGLICLKQQNKTTNRDIWNFFSQTIEEIQLAFLLLPLEERSALKHIDKGETTTSATIISVLQERISFLKYLVDMEGDFSFKKFVREERMRHDGVFKPHPNLFILNIEQYKTIFKPLMSLAIDTLIRETLSLPDKLDRRLFFIIDELGSLYRMESIIDLLTIGRSKGGCLICANQDLGRFEEAYGKYNTQTFYNNFNTNFIFRIRDPDTTEFLSKAMGERQVIKRVESRSLSPSDMGDRKSFSDQEKTERLFMPTEFQEQKDRQAIMVIANFGVTKIEVPAIYYQERYPNFMMKQFPEVFATDIPNEAIKC